MKQKEKVFGCKKERAVTMEWPWKELNVKQTLKKNEAKVKEDKIVRGVWQEREWEVNLKEIEGEERQKGREENREEKKASSVRRKQWKRGEERKGSVSRQKKEERKNKVEKAKRRKN